MEEGTDTHNLVHTKISGQTVVEEVVALRMAGLKSDPSNSWFLMSTLLLAIMDMEHRLEMHQSLGMRNIYFNPDRTVTILNPYFRDAHLIRILEDIIVPILHADNWKPEYSQSYHSRVQDLNKNPALKAIHFVHQNYVTDMLKSAALIVLGMISLRLDEEYIVDIKKNTNRNNLNYAIINADLDAADNNGGDSDLIDLLEFILKNEPPSAIELAKLVNEDQFAKIYKSMTEGTLVCSDPPRAKELLREFRHSNPYAPGYNPKMSTDIRQTALPQQTNGMNQQSGGPNMPLFFPLLGPGMSAPNNYQQPWPQQMMSGTNPQGNQERPTGAMNGNPSVNPTIGPNYSNNPQDSIGTAKELKELKNYQIGQPTGVNPKSNNLPSKIEKLKDFEYSAGDNKPGFKKGQDIAKNIDLLRRYTRGGEKPETISQAQTLPSRPVRQTDLDYNSAPLIRQPSGPIRQDYPQQPPMVRRCMCSANCKCKKPLAYQPAYPPAYPTTELPSMRYSPYSHIYYMGRPLSGTENELLHGNPVSSM